MNPPTIKTPVTVERGEELGHTIWVLLDAAGEYVCETAEHETADEIARLINDSARLRAELDEAIEKLRPISRYYPGDFVHNAHGSEVFTFRFTVDQWNAIRRLVARHEGRKG